MSKRLQNRVAESRMALPAVALYTTLVWMLCGLLTHHWWLQFGCLAVTAYLTVLLNNVHALIRIYSPMVSCTFLVLTCCACFLFPSTNGAFAQLCMTACLLILFNTYQDRQSAGYTYYAFLFVGLASTVTPQLLFYLPLLWLLMATNLLALSWRTWTASLLGYLTPYWIYTCWLAFQGDVTRLATPWLLMGSALSSLRMPSSLLSYPLPLLLTVAFTALLAVTGIVHYIRNSHNDKIRTRMFYYFFTAALLYTALLLLLQPQFHDLLIRLLIVFTAPLAAHFVALTSTRYTNIAFITLTSLALLLTIDNVWAISSLF